MYANLNWQYLGNTVYNGNGENTKLNGHQTASEANLWNILDAKLNGFIVAGCCIKY